LQKRQELGVELLQNDHTLPLKWQGNNAMHAKSGLGAVKPLARFSSGLGQLGRYPGEDFDATESVEIKAQG
tara:strand:- start:93 stop:305 length:213 start_codon:yes stop_codon:yes gene_type:complete